MALLREVLETWSSVYSNSAALRRAITFAHIGGLVGSAGVAVASDTVSCVPRRRARRR